MFTKLTEGFSLTLTIHHSRFTNDEKTRAAKQA